MTSNYVPGLRLEFARFYGETGHFKLNFFIENSNFSQFFLSGIHIHTFSHNFEEKKISFHRHFKREDGGRGLKSMRDVYKETRLRVTCYKSTNEWIKVA